MKLYEFIFLILSIISLIDYILVSIIIYKHKELYYLVGLRFEVEIKRLIEILIIIITLNMFLYKFLYKFIL